MSLSMPDHSSKSPTPKVAMKGFSLSLTNNTKLKSAPGTSLGKRPRSTFSQDDAEGSEDEITSGAKHESVIEFGAEGAIIPDERKSTQLLVIPKLKNRDWKTEARAMRGKNLLPAEVQAVRAGGGGKGAKEESGEKHVDEQGQIQWGLSVRTRIDGDTKDVDLPTMNDREGHTGGNSEDSEGPRVGKTEDELALAAILNDGKKRSGPELVIPALSDTQVAADDDPALEEDTLKRDLRTAPDVSTLEDYERMPVEEFGAALLRGMGWKGEKNAGPKEVKRRQNLLGLGAKHLKDAEELGAWVQKSDVKRLNNSSGGNGHRSGDRRPRASEYRREEERRKERREERHGSGYRKDR